MDFVVWWEERWVESCEWFGAERWVEVPLVDLLQGTHGRIRSCVWPGTQSWVGEGFVAVGDCEIVVVGDARTE